MLVHFYLQAFILMFIVVQQLRLVFNFKKSIQTVCYIKYLFSSDG